MSRYQGSQYNVFIRQIALLLFIVFSASGVVCASEYTLSSGFHYDWWDSDEGDKGMQFYLPIQAASEYRGVSFEVLSAYAYTRVDPSGGSARSLSDFVDTKVDFAYGLKGKYGCDIILGLGFNLPTGHTDLSTRDLVLVVPPDLMSINSFGEGLNMNPRVSVARQWDKLVAGIGLGYAWRGEYDYSDSVADYDPGEIFTLNGEAAYEFSPQWYGKAYGEYESFSKDTVEGNDYYQEGDVTLIGCGLRYVQPAWELGISLTGIFRDKSKIQQGIAVPTEEHNSHGDEWIAQVIHHYFQDKDTTITTSLEYFSLDENEYGATSLYYIGKRQKITLACMVSKILREDLEASASIKGFIMDDEENWYHPGEDYMYRGFSLGASVTKGF